MTQANILSAAGSVGVSQAFKSRIINGGMVVDQRNAGAAQNPITSGNFIVDRFQFGATTAGKFSAQQNAGSVTPPAGFTNYAGLTVVSAYSVAGGDVFYLSQQIEGFNTADLNFGSANAKTVTLSFWVYSSVAGTYGVRLGNSAGNRSYVSTYTINSANTWQQISITIAGDASGTWVGATNGIGIQVLWTLAGGATFQTTANSWQTGNYTTTSAQTQLVGTNGATFYITGVQLEVGTTATNFEVRSYGTELALCQRYYVNMNGTTNSYQSLFIGALYNTTSGSYIMNLPVPMRTIPTITTSGTIYAQNLSINVSSLAGPYSQVGSLLEGDFTLASASTSGNFVFVRWNNIASGSRSFNISAEL